MAISKEEVEASMARIKALQAMLAGGPAPVEEEEEYDPNDPAQQYKEEDNDAWREEQERIWEAEQAALREAAAKEKAALESGAAAAAPASAVAGASTAATPAASSSSSSSAAAASSTAVPAAPASGPHQWSASELSSWLRSTVAPLVLRRSDIFLAKGWTAEEVGKWKTEMSAGFTAAAAQVDAKQISGAQAAAWDVATDKPWGEQLHITNQYMRAAVWASWKQELRQWQDAQNKK